MNVAVTGVGGGVGQSIIKSLQDTEYEVVGIDGEALGTGLYATRKSYIGYYASDARFIERTIDICKDADCGILFPGLDAELIPISKARDELIRNGVFPIVSDANVVEIADDKLETSRFLDRNGFPSVETYSLAEYSNELDYPVLLKPKKGGARSIGIFVIRNRSEFENRIVGLDSENYVVQEYVEGDEFTCGTLSFGKGCIGAIVMRRQLRNGDTYKAFVVKDSKLSDYVKSVVEVLKPFGPCNVQMRVRDGTPFIFEFNARCSGTTASRALAGFNEPMMVCDFVTKGIDNPKYDIKEIAVLRYWNELATDYGAIDELKDKWKVHLKGSRL
jgi:carbamoyl-phosphate synthase large subunit